MIKPTTRGATELDILPEGQLGLLGAFRQHAAVIVVEFHFHENDRQRNPTMLLGKFVRKSYRAL